MARKKQSSKPPTPAQLRRMVREAPDAPSRKQALGRLVELQPRGVNKYLTELALDEQVDESVRLDAVTVLGKKPTPTALDGLRAALSVDEPTVRQRAISRLGKVGTEDDLARLKEVRSGNRVTQRVLRAAKLLLSHRHGLGEYRLDVPTRVFAAGEGESMTIEVRRVTPKAAEELTRLVETPGVDIVWEAARRLECGPNRYLFAITKGHTGSSMAALTERQGLPAVLLTYNDETGRYTPGYYFLTDPATKNRFHIHGMRGSGRPALYGTGVVEEGVVHFEVNAIETPLEPPVTVKGTYELETGAIDFEVAMSDPRLAARQRRLRKEPRLQQGPVG